MQLKKPPLPAITVKLSKYNVDDVALGVCKTGAEEAGVTEVRTSLSEKKFELWREIFFFLMIRLPPRSTLFPYTALSRSLAWTSVSALGQPGRKPLWAYFANSYRCEAPGELTRSEEHTSELQSPCNLVCRLLLEKKKNYGEK